MKLNVVTEHIIEESQETEVRNDVVYSLYMLKAILCLIYTFKLNHK